MQGLFAPTGAAGPPCFRTPSAFSRVTLKGASSACGFFRAVGRVSRVGWIAISEFGERKADVGVLEAWFGGVV